MLDSQPSAYRRNVVAVFLTMLSIFLVTSAITEAAPVVYVARESAGLYSGPGWHFRSIGRLSGGTRVEVYGEERDWLKIKLSNGGYGYAQQSRFSAVAAARPPAPPSRNSDQRREWVACVYNEDHRDREIQVIWWRDRGQGGPKNRCDATQVVPSGESSVFRCDFRSDPSVQLVVWGRGGDEVRLNAWANVAPAEGRYRECSWDNSSTIVRDGRELNIMNGKPRNERSGGRGYGR